MTFSVNSEYLLSSDDKAVRVWRVRDDERITSLEAEETPDLVVSKDGRWHAARTRDGSMFVWDAKTLEQVFSHESEST